MFGKKHKPTKDEMPESKDVTFEPADEETGEENLRKKIKDLRQKLEVCSKERADYLAGWQRAKADYINLQKENTERQTEILEYAATRIFGGIIPVLDSFEIAMADKAAWNESPENWRRGVEYIYSQLKKALENQGVSEICPSINDVVKYELHSIVETVTTGIENDSGKIAKVLQKGYKLKDKIIRPARVTAYFFKGSDTDK